MLDKKLTKTGSILMHQGKIQIEGFEADGCTCREVAVKALRWAIEEMQSELIGVLLESGDSNVSLDFGPALCALLEIDPWAEE